MKKNLLLAVFSTFSCLTTFAQTPGGETCATATVIPSIPYIGRGNTSAAANNLGSFCPDVNGSTGGKDLVYSYTTGAEVEYVNLSLCDSITNFDSKIYVYAGSCVAGNVIACQDDGCQSPDLDPGQDHPYNSRIDNLELAANTTFYFVVDGYNANASGDYQLTVTVGEAPPPPPPAIIPFTNQTSLLSTATFHSGVAIASADMNNDKLDDIVRLANNNKLYVEYQQPNGSFVVGDYSALTIGNPWSVCIGDVDNNGYNDIMYGNNGNAVLLRDNGTGGFTSAGQIQSSSIFCQGINFVDINVDGKLDAFLCNDVGLSHIYEGNGTGAFTRNNELIPNLPTVPTSDNSGNYASMWTDYDLDGDTDLYISKCRQGVTSSTDPRRINQLFRNNGDGTYTEVGAAAGLASGAQTWVSDFGDIDNDGDLDAAIFNHDVPGAIMLNNGDGTFSDITASTGIEANIQFTVMQVLFRDFDNDGFIDILATGDKQRLFHNNGNRTFTWDVSALKNGTNEMESFTCGDFNHDGFVDVYAGYAAIYNSPTTINDVLFLNNKTSNHNYLVVDLTGTVSNKNAIGAVVQIYGAWGVQTREVRSGEGYGIQNTFAQHFGLGQSNMVDSVVVRFPSGIVNVMENVAANQFIQIIENQTVSTTNSTVSTFTSAVFPNPASNNATILIHNFSQLEQPSLRITDINGKVIMEMQQLKDANIPISMRELGGKGVYFYEIYANKTRVNTGKIVFE